MIEHSSFYIDGAWSAPSSSEVLRVVNPTTETEIARVPAGQAADIDRAVQAAAAAQPDWSARTPAERAQWCERIAGELRQREGEISELISREVGCPLSFSLSVQTQLPIDKLAAMVPLVETISFTHRMGRTEVSRVGVGVVAAITPWNYPLLQVVEKVAPALVAGCTVVLKPSEVTPLTAYVLAEAVHAVGLPPGVFNLVAGTGREAGAPLVGHPLVDMVSFTGSTVAGREISRVAAATVKATAMELGGKSASVVLPDVDDELLRRAVTRTVSSAVSNSGQTCSALTRLVVPAGLRARAEEFARDAASALTVGDPFDPDTRLGPLVSAAQRDRVADYVRRGVAEGAVLLTGGEPSESSSPGTGYFFPPTVFSQVTADMVIAREEIFGPVLVILTYDDGDIDAAIEIANATDYGLAGAVWSASEEQARRVAARIETGVVSINGGMAADDAPFGGFKQSGHGRESGVAGIEEYLTSKVYAF